VLQSLIFQLILKNKSLSPIIHEAYLSNYASLTGNREFVKDLFLALVRDSGPVFIVIDGVDEARESDGSFLLKSLIAVAKSDKNIMLLISSRPERAISKELALLAISVRVEENNADDIATFVEYEGKQIVSQFEEYGADEDVCMEITTAISNLSRKAQGMILYAKLVIGISNVLIILVRFKKRLRSCPKGLIKRKKPLTPPHCTWNKTLLSKEIFVYTCEPPSYSILWQLRAYNKKNQG
jgi:hypothetical protein